MIRTPCENHSEAGLLSLAVDARWHDRLVLYELGPGSRAEAATKGAGSKPNRQTRFSARNRSESQIVFHKSAKKKKQKETPANNTRSFFIDSGKEYTTGKMYDEDTGLYYFHARWYDPEVGRFVSSDPVTRHASKCPSCTTPYLFVDANPLRKVDPSGLYPMWRMPFCYCCALAAGDWARAHLPVGFPLHNEITGHNAFLHCLLNCFTVKHCGTSCASWFWDRRETRGILFDEIDLYNNKQGRHCAWEVPEKSWERGCWDCCLSKWADGELKCVAPTERVDTACPPPDPAPAYRNAPLI
jgi:RHS repeat-associated protein